ncbi:hypothetical protein HN803_05660 [candidate division WWE3 bacterium]|jgi:hypothetical protein|nr:hypothetical protein [candidate division WWE3 bacterium]MBT7350246.1 hypothetical protein [candidate division WWE3 bacterium]
MTRGGWKILIWIVAIARALFPFIIFKFPFLAIFLNLFLDAPDGFISYKSGWKWKRYHVYDKIADWWWYLFIVFYSSSLPIFPIILTLFVIRSIGQFYSAYTKNEKMLLYTPNIMEYYFVFYLISTKLAGLTVEMLSPFNLILLLVAVIVSISQEYRIHVKKSYFANSVFGLSINWEDNESTDETGILL